LQYRREEEEEPEEGEEIELPRRPASPRPIPQAPPPKAARPVKPLPKSKAPAAAPPQPTPKAAPPPAVVTARAPSPKARPVVKPKKTKPIAHPPPTTTTYPDEEVIEFGKPAKRARPSTPQQPPPAAPAPVTLHLPGGSTSFAPPPAPLKSVVATSAPAASPPTIVQDDSDEDEEDWEQVSTTAPVVPDSQSGFELTLEESLEEEIFGDSFTDADGGEEIDANAFEKELNEEMDDSEDDFLTAAVMSDPEQHTSQPISLNRLASGAGAADSEDDFSSSDESDED